MRKRIVVWLCAMMLCLCACTTDTISVTLENQIHVTVRLAGTTWADLVWQIDGTTYTAIDTPTVSDPVVHLVSGEMPTITVQLPNDLDGTVVFTIPTEDGMEQVCTAPASEFQALLDWRGGN